jgi:hypothetical protein
MALAVDAVGKASSLRVSSGRFARALVGTRFGMTDPEAVWVAAMPDDLDEAVERLSSADRGAAIKGWLAVGGNGRRQFIESIESAAFNWVRQLRCNLAVRRLIRAGEPWL